MIVLNDRLHAIADRLDGVKTMADIGTDHGFLPVFLLQQGICDRAILTDISAASLAKAEECCMNGLSGGYELRVGDGLSVLKMGEADAVVIAGVGGILITEIMARDMDKTLSIGRFVLQPRNGQGKLRRWLCDNGFAIIGEDVVVEGSHMPEIITVSPPGEALRDGGSVTVLNQDILSERTERTYASADGGRDVDEICYRIPPWILEARGPVGDFLERALKKEKQILESVMLSRERDEGAEAERCRNINYLKDLLERYEYERKNKE